jgi:hypothetical protein
MEPIILSTNCFWYNEDPAICDDIGEPKGQCVHCGAKWYEHDINALPLNERDSARAIQRERGISV